MKFLILTGSTPVDVRQSLVDEFTEDESISIFLLSTKAGGKSADCHSMSVLTVITGMGINLTAASVVIMYVFLLRVIILYANFRP